VIAPETVERKKTSRPQGGALFGNRPIQKAALRLAPHQHVMSTYVANVAGPRLSLHFAGAPVLEVFPVVPLMGNISVGVGALSYAAQFNMMAVADRDLCPDLEIFVEGMRRSLGTPTNSAVVGGFSMVNSFGSVRHGLAPRRTCRSWRHAHLPIVGSECRNRAGGRLCANGTSASHCPRIAPATADTDMAPTAGSSGAPNDTPERATGMGPAAPEPATCAAKQTELTRTESVMPLLQRRRSTSLSVLRAEGLPVSGRSARTGRSVRQRLVADVCQRRRSGSIPTTRRPDVLAPMICAHVLARSAYS
jgi:hypothetical protein